MVLAHGPVPSGLPLLGVEGKDRDGYPTQYVDQAGLRSLLHRRRFDDLDRHIDQLQAAFEADPRKEYWPLDASDAFDSAELSLMRDLDAWVGARPSSSAALVSRASHWIAVGFWLRGVAHSAETSAEQFNGMYAAFDEAAADLDRALALRPGLLAAIRKQLVLGRARGARYLDEAIGRGEAICPSCFQLRVAAIYSRSPRWGGSHAAMQALASRAPVATNARLRLLPGYVDLDMGESASVAKRYDEAIAALDRACALGDHWEFFQVRGERYRYKGDQEKALADLDRALALRPGHADALLARAAANGQLSRWEPAALDLIAGLRVAPTHEQASLRVPIAQGLKHQGWKLYQEGKRDEALRLYDLAVELTPGDRDARGYRANAILDKLGTSPADLAKVTSEAGAAPDDFRAQQRLDYALARQRQFDRVIPIWDAYLQRHPDHARAYLERSGAHQNLGKADASLADRTRACDLGLSEACAGLPASAAR